MGGKVVVDMNAFIAYRSGNTAAVGVINGTTEQVLHGVLFLFYTPTMFKRNFPSAVSKEQRAVK